MSDLRTVVYERRRGPSDSGGVAESEDLTATEANISRVAPGPSRWTFVGWISIGGGVLAFLVLALTTEPGFLEAILVIPIAVLCVWPIVRNARRYATFDLGSIVLTGFGFKLMSTAVRWWFSFEIDGSADAGVYSTEGARLARSFRQFDFDVDLGRPIPGTGWPRLFTGIIYTVTGERMPVAFVIYSVLAFMGVWLCYKAFELAVPDGAHRRYALLVLFWPSLLFWPASIGKEAWMLLAIGLTAHGAARLLRHRRGGFPISGLGLLATGVVRPHITALLFTALFLAYMFRPSVRSRVSATLSKGLGVVLLLVTGLVVAGQAEDFFALDELSLASVEETLEDTSEQTSGDDATFDAIDLSRPTNYPYAVFTVLFRPLFFEAHNASALVSAAEGMLLAAAIVIFVPFVWRALIQVRRRPYVVFALAYTAMFGVTFSVLNNFGILSRQRVQVLPFVLALLALPRMKRLRAPRQRV